MNVFYPIPSGFTALGGTWNPASLGSGLSLSGGNLVITTSSGGAWENARSTVQLQSVGGGKVYWETNAVQPAIAGFLAGFDKSSHPTSGYPGDTAGSGFGVTNSSTGAGGEIWVGGTQFLYGPDPFYSNSTKAIGFACDTVAKKLYIQTPVPGASGVLAWYGATGVANAANPAAGTGGYDISAVLTGNDYAMTALFSTADVTSANGAFTGLTYSQLFLNPGPI